MNMIAPFLIPPHKPLLGSILGCTLLFAKGLSEGYEMLHAALNIQNKKIAPKENRTPPDYNIFGVEHEISFWVLKFCMGLPKE
jgi:hypothetical protein